MSSTPRTDEAEKMVSSEEGYHFVCQSGFARELESELIAKTASAEVSAALIAEHKKLLSYIVEAEEISESASCVTDHMRAARELLAKTPESVGADLAKREKRLAYVEEQLLWHVGRGETIQEILNSLEISTSTPEEGVKIMRTELAQQSVRISELETTNRDQLDSLSFCKGEITELQESLATNRRALAANANVSVKLNQEFARANEAEERIKNLENALNDSIGLTYVPDKNQDEQWLEERKRIESLLEAVKPSGNRPETDETVDEKIARRVREVVADFGSLGAFFSAVEARKTGGVQP